MTATHCFACGSRALYPFYECKGIPVHSCLMVSSKEEALQFPRGDLRLDLCRSCGFVQNSCFDPSQNAYSSAYEETQEFSPRFREFQRDLCDRISRRYALRDKTVLEIGCGKGSFLEDLALASGCAGIGFDPSYRPERRSDDASRRVRFVQDFYSDAYAHVDADLVCCRHTLEHIQPVRDFLATVAAALVDRPGTPVLFEVPDTERILRDCAFEDIYYEHCSYFTPGSLARAFAGAGFRVEDVYKEYGGQYLIIEASSGAGDTPYVSREDDLAAADVLVRRFAARLTELVGAERDRIGKWRAHDKKLAIWGSGSKAVSYTGIVQLGSDDARVVDINAHKHGKFLAGTGHCILSPESLTADPPDVVLVMNSIYRDEIRAALAAMDLHPEIAVLLSDEGAREEG